MRQHGAGIERVGQALRAILAGAGPGDHQQQAQGRADAPDVAAPPAGFRHTDPHGGKLFQGAAAMQRPDRAGDRIMLLGRQGIGGGFQRSMRQQVDDFQPSHRGGAARPAQAAQAIPQGAGQAGAEAGKQGPVQPDGQEAPDIEAGEDEKDGEQIASRH